VVSFLIKRSSKGPVFFKQQRVGYNGRLFNCLKFRTMVENAEELRDDLLELNEMDGPVFKIKNDPRLTKVGKILRKTSIDELPQFINVLRGDMSLVGPRPPIPSEVKEYELVDRRRLSMRPGITCLWQVNGRNSIPFEKWMELDRQYIDQWSLWLDFKILAKTIPAVLRGSGAA
jgi:lipopolysaccharide/colanic/teichoic acid biosynthesis glycosyltransferase